MNSIIGDSRVSYIKTHRSLFKKVEVEDVWSRPGGRLEHCVDMIEENLQYHHPPLTPGMNHYYILSGICDVTTKLASQEVIFNYDDLLINELKAKLDNVNIRIVKQGVLPVFCTIIPMHLETWNKTRLAQGKTMKLIHMEKYPQMQKDLETALDELNHHIIKINSLKSLATPLTHTSLLKRQNKVYYHLYGLLPDGCHPSEKATERIIKTINNAVVLNKDKH